MQTFRSFRRGKSKSFCVRQLTVLLLVFLFLFTPVIQVFADLDAQDRSSASTPASTVSDAPPADSITDTGKTVTLGSGDSQLAAPITATDQTTVTDDQPTSDLSVKRDAPNGKLKDANSQQLSAMSSTTTQQAGSNISKSSLKQLLPQTDQSSGALTYNYPITVPSGRNYMQPDLQLAYNNQTAEEGSIFGNGWSISIPYIERINRKGIDQLYSQDYFNSSMSGELLNIGGSSWGAKVDDGDFLNYTYSNSTWTVKDKKGTIYTFGSVSASRQDNPGDSTKIYRWMLQEARDTNNNYIKYTYYKDAGQIYPASIIYTGNGITDGIFEVDFLRQSRTDNAAIYKTGFSVASNYRINEIDTKVSGTLAHKYVLAYGTGANGMRSILTSIIESGYDDAAVVTTLPATTFNYQPQTAGWTNDTSWTMPHDSQYTNSILNSFPPTDKMTDVNGDGLVDIIASRNSYISVYINNGHGWAYDPSWYVPSDPSGRSLYFNSENSIVVDINGDGLPDVIYAPAGSGTTIYINNGHGWTYDTSWTMPHDSKYTNSILNSFPPTDKMTDVNGDGLVDIIASRNNYVSVYINNGHGWAYNPNWYIPVNSLSADTSSVVDVNGDGLPDILYSSGGSTTTYINNGYSWTNDKSWTMPHDPQANRCPTCVINLYPSLDTLTDVNGDGLVDIITSRNSSIWIYINNGHGWVYDSSWYMPINSLSGDTTIIVDVNSDGLPDIIYAPAGCGTTFYINNGHKIDSLTHITNSQGGTTDITYKSSPQYVNGSTLLNPKTPMVLETVSKITNSDGLGNTFNENYKYEGGELYYNSAFDRKFAGFAKVTVTDDAGNNTINYYHQGNTTNSAQGEYDDNISKAGKIYRTEITNSSGSIYSKTINKWDRYDLGNGRSFVKQAQQLNMAYDGDATHRDSAETYTYDNTNGNMMQKVQLGEVIGNDNGTYTDVGTDDYTTAYAYASNTAANILGLPDDVTVTDHNANKIKEDRYYYDAQALGSAIRGNQTKHEMWKSGSVYISTQKTYDSTYGLVTQDTDANSKNTAYVYDTYNLYPATVTDPLNHTGSFTYDYSSGKVKQKTDPNMRIFQNVYDGLDRLITEKQPDLSNPSSLVNKTVYTFIDTPGAVSVQKTDYLDGVSAVNTYTYFDGLGRKIQERKQAEGGNYEVKDYAYNNLDLLQKESLPYFSSGSSKTAVTATAALYTVYAYDPMYRVATATDAAGTVTNTYSDWKLTVTDKLGKNKDLYKDAYGNLIEVDEHNLGSTYITAYAYDGLGDLTKLTDASGNVRNFTYNGLGQRLTAEDLHASSDTSFGTWIYIYDNNGNLTSKVDPKSQTVNYTYDDTNRPLTEDYTGQSGTEVAYVYDVGTDGIGRLYLITTPSYTQTNTYNPLGNLASESKVIGTNTYTTSYTYDRQGNQLTITNPDNSVIKYEYGTGGLLDKVSRKENTDSGYAYVISNFDYSPMEQPTTVAYTNGMTTTNTYDASKLYRLSSKVTTIAAGVHGQDISYTYDNNGNITVLTDNSGTDSKKTVAYTYDDFNRLTSATATNVATGQSPYTENYTYDAIGNITSKTGQGSYTYAGNQGISYANPHAATMIGSTTLTYDNNGNLLNKGSALSNTWDYNNRITQSVAGATTDTYAYDVSGERIKSSNGTLTTIYPTKLYNTDGTAPTKHIFANGIEIATITGTGATGVIHYTATDNLTGSNLTTTASDAKEELLDYMSFGTIRIDQKAGSYSDQRKYGGHEYDANTNLSYMDARYYDPAIGRFLSQDPNFLDSSFDLTDPQDLNSYAYARNNPVKNIDPDGKSWQTGLQGLTGFVSYAYNHPLQTAGTVVATAAVATVAPAAVAVAGAALGIYTLGTSAYNAYTAPNADVRDYYIGQGVSAAALTLAGIKGASSLKSAEGVLPDSAYVCRGGTCQASNFLKGSNEYKNGLNPGPNSPLTGISVNAGNDLDPLLKSGNLPNYGQYGKTTLKNITKTGGKLAPDFSNKTNPTHANINGLNANQLEKLFTPTKKNPFKIK